MTSLTDNSSDQSIEGLGSLLYWFKEPSVRRQLEQFRVKYEKEFGPTDITKRYTSLWPEKDQTWMVKNELKRYWDGLPPFVQAFMKGRMDAAHRAGTLENEPDSNLLRLYLQRQMSIGGDGYTR
jgi:hypothetical protein